jgi:hypothetical protein
MGGGGAWVTGRGWGLGDREGRGWVIGRGWDG